VALQSLDSRGPLLPRQAVIGNFNNWKKFDPDTVALWARVMRRLPHSVLWLLATLPYAGIVPTTALTNVFSPRPLALGHSSLCWYTKLICANVCVCTCVCVCVCVCSSYSLYTTLFHSRARALSLSLTLSLARSLSLTRTHSLSLTHTYGRRRKGRNRDSTATTQCQHHAPHRHFNASKRKAPGLETAGATSCVVCLSGPLQRDLLQCQKRPTGATSCVVCQVLCMCGSQQLIGVNSTQSKHAPPPVFPTPSSAPAKDTLCPFARSSARCMTVAMPRCRPSQTHQSQDGRK